MLRRPIAHPMSSGKIITFLLDRSIPGLILYYMVFYILLIIAFAMAYYKGNYVNSNNKGSIDFLSCIYFSVISQSTLGYGDLVPLGYGRLFVCVQVLISGLYTVLFLGIIIAKILWPPDAIIISDIAVFDILEEKFRFRFYNAHRLPLCNTIYNISLRGVSLSGNQLIHRNYRAKIQFPGHPIIEAKKPWVVNTESCKDKQHSRLDPSKENVLSPEHLTANSILTIHIEGHYPKIGGHSCYGIMRIPIENIKCGRLAFVEEIDNAGKLINKDWNNFNSYIPTDVLACNLCKRNSGCFLAKRINQ